MRSRYDKRAEWLLLVLLQLPIRPCYGQSAPAQAPAALPAGVSIGVQVQPQKATIGDPIRIDLDITMPEGFQASLPRLGGQVGDFVILEFYPGPSLPAEGKSQPAGPSREHRRGAPIRHQARIVTALYKTGEFEFPPIPVTLKTPDGKEIKTSSQPIKIQIRSVLADKNPQLKGLKRQAEIQEPVRWLLWFALGFLALILAGLGWWLYQRRHRPSYPMPGQPQVDPLVLAEADLRDLIGRGLLEKGFVKPFYVLLSDIVKRMLGAGYGIHTIEKTTSEIMEQLGRGTLSNQDAGEMRRIELVLFGCDLVKFAKYIPSAAENDSAIKNSFSILESARKVRSVPSSAGEAAAAGVP